MNDGPSGTIGRAPVPSADTLDESKIRFVDVDGVSTRYYEAGAGEPLVLIHGGHYGFIDSLDTWSLNLDALAEHFHVFAFDKLGQGYTDPPADDAGYTYDAVLAHARGWFDAVGLTKAHILGHSRGGLPAAALAAEGRATSLIIVSSATLGPDPVGTDFDPLAFYEEIDRQIDSDNPSLENVWVEARANSFSTAHVTDGYLQRYLEISRRPEHIAAAKKMVERLNKEVFVPSITRHRQEMLRRIDDGELSMRTLVVWGREDPSALFQNIGLPLWNRLCETNRDVELHVFNEAGHYSYREYAEQFNRLLIGFCSAATG